MRHPEASSARDLRLDVFRGLALVMIFINHTPGTVFENLTSRNFGFSDAAEGFVLMSGSAAALAYAKFFAGPGPYWAGTGRMWRRVWTLYQVHIVTTVIAVGIAAATALWFGGFEMMQKNVVSASYKKPLQYMIGIPLLTHQLGYANILPLYAVLLFAGPVLLWSALRWPLRTMAVSVLVWALVARFWINFPAFPNKGGWFFNPLSWQLLFVLGLLIGIKLKQGQRLVPVRRDLLALAVAWLLVGLGVAQLPAIQDEFGHVLWFVQDRLNLPWFVMAFDKTYLSGPRLTHALALAYVLSAFPAVRQACAHRLAAPFALLGRNGLAVFGFGVVLCYTANGIKTVLPASFALDLAVISAGVLLMLALAWSKEAWRRAEQRAR